MKRDLDLIREILLKIEACEPKHIGEMQRVSPKDFSGTEPQNMHHIALLIDAGLLECAGQTIEPTYLLHGMSMEGHDFLDAVRAKSIWKHVTKRLTASRLFSFLSLARRSRLSCPESRA